MEKKYFIELSTEVQEKVLQNFMASDSFAVTMKKDNRDFELAYIGMVSKGVFTNRTFSTFVKGDKAIFKFLAKVYDNSIPTDIYYAVKFGLIEYIHIQGGITQEPVKIVFNVTAKCLHDVVGDLKNHLEKWVSAIKVDVAENVKYNYEWLTSHEGAYNYLIDTDWQFDKAGKRIWD